jgi:hypothetical protein
VAAVHADSSVSKSTTYLDWQDMDTKIFFLDILFRNSRKIFSRTAVILELSTITSKGMFP